MALSGVFKAFWFWTADYASTYISQVSIKRGWYRFLSNFMRIYIASTFLCLLACFGFLMLFLTKKISRHHKVFLVFFALFSAMSICPGFYFRPHYFVLLLPCVSLFIGIGISAFSGFLSKFFSKKIYYGIPLLLIIVCLSDSIYKQRDYLFDMTPQEISRSTYGMCPFPESLVLADYLNKNTTPEDRIAILGSEPQIFFYAKRRSASSYIYMYPLMENHQFAVQMQKDFIKDVETRKPKYILYMDIFSSWTHQRDSHNDIFKWFHSYQKDRYELVGVAELVYDDKTIYHWKPSFKWPFIPFDSIAIFKRNAL